MNPIALIWFTISTSDSGGWGHHYPVACPTYNSINRNTCVGGTDLCADSANNISI